MAKNACVNVFNSLLTTIAINERHFIIKGAFMNQDALSKTLRHFPKLVLGLFIVAVGTKLNINANLGMNPWGTFHQGLSNLLGMRFGTASQLTGLVILILSLFIKIYPGVGTVFNMFFIGFVVDLLPNFPIPDLFIWRLIALSIGILLFNYGVYLYLSCELGAGPRDGLMVGLVKLTGAKVSTIRPLIEGSILILGIVLGGAYGIGTIANVLLGGFILERIFNFFNFNAKRTQQMILTDYLLKS